VASEAHAVAVDDHGAHGHGPAHLHHHFDNLEQQRECTSLGMWSFLITEVMMFGGLFFAYSLYRWRFPVGFHEGSKHLVILWGTINTFVLLFSSLTMALAVHAAVTRNRKRLVAFLVATWILGAVFLGVKAVEWKTDFDEGLIPGLAWHYYDKPEHMAELQHAGGTPEQVLMYFIIYFSMTGLHALHMIIGLGIVGYMAWLAQKGVFTNGNDQPIEITGLYWHFVDIVWIFLFPLLYLIAGFNLFKPGGGH
jgi:cytochrome c oxidase subunit III